MAKKLITEAEMDKITTDTAAALAKQPKKEVKIPVNPDIAQKLKNDINHKDWPFTTVQVNGYTYQIKHGVKVEVPQTIYEILEQSGRI